VGGGGGCEGNGEAGGGEHGGGSSSCGDFPARQLGGRDTPFLPHFTHTPPPPPPTRFPLPRLDVVIPITSCVVLMG